MQTQAQIEEILKQTLQLSPADETEVRLFTQDSALTRFANNTIHQNVAETDTIVTVKAVVGKRMGTAETNHLSQSGLTQAVERAMLHAQQQPEDPDFPGLPPAQAERQAVDSFDPQTAAFTPQARASHIQTICQLAAAHSLQAYGSFRTSSSTLAIANSHGLMAHHPSTLADLQIIAATDHGSGRAHASSWQVEQIDVSRLGQEAVEKAVLVQQPHPIEPGEYTVVLDHYAVQDIIQWLSFSGASAQAMQEGRSWMNGRLGTQVMSPAISIWDDGHDPAGIPLPFDAEGTPRQRVQIVKDGVPQGPVYDRYTAQKEGQETTGHAIPSNFRFFSGPLPFNLFMASGSHSVEEMIQSTPKGLYITRFWYTRLVHPRDCVVTGMTRDGVILIEDGKLTRPIKNLRFTQSYLQALASVQAVGSKLHTLASEYTGGGIRVPALKIERFNFTGQTA